MKSASNDRPVLPLYVACVMLCYTQAAGVTTIYSMASMLYRIFNDPLRIGWVITSYYLVAAGGSAICGRFADLLGRRKLAIILLAIGGIGGQILFLLLATATVSDPARSAGSLPAEAGYTLGFGYIAVMGLIGLAIAWFVPGRIRKHHQ